MRISLTAFLLASAPLAAHAQSIFGSGVISTPDSDEAFGSMTPDGKEFYFTIHRPDFSRHRIVVSRLTNAGWSAPQTLSISGTYNDREPKLSPDGKRLYFSSNRPVTAGDTTRRRDLDLWFSDRRPDGSWAASVHIEGPNGPTNDFSPSVTAGGVLYFISKRSGGIGKDSLPYNVWRAEPIDLVAGRWKAPVNAGTAINAGFETNVYVTPNESTMLASRDDAPDSFGGDDVYFSRRVGGVWKPMTHLPAPINSKEYDYGPLISPDGQSIFVTSHRTGNGDIYRFPIGLLDATAGATGRRPK